MKTYKERLTDKKQSNRTKVLKVTAFLVEKYGISNFTFNQLAKESKLGVASIYRYFGNKTELIFETAVYLLKEIILIVENKLKEPSFIELSGIKRIESLLDLFLVVYSENQSFFKYIGEFDRFLSHHEIPKDKYNEYDNLFSSFYDFSYSSFLKGQKDGSIKKEIDFKTFYYSITRVLMNTCEKGAIDSCLIPSDLEIPTEKQIEQLIKMAIFYIKGE